MLRLWPRTIMVGLFEHSATVSVRGAKSVSLSTSSHASLESWLVDFTSLMQAANIEMRRGDRICVIVSDSFTAVMPLPWQSALSNEDDLASYARLLLEKEDSRINDAWIVQSIRPRWGAPGLAYALPRSVVDKVVSYIASKNCVLESITPLSVTAFLAEHDMRHVLKSILLMSEVSQIHCMVFDAGVLTVRDTEPVAESFEIGLSRLLKRIVSLDTDWHRATIWVNHEDQWATVENAVIALMPNASRIRADWGKAHVHG